MRAILIGIMAIHWITVPVVLQSCCGGLHGGDDVYYNIDTMSVIVSGPTQTASLAPSKLADLSFLVGFQVTRAALESANGYALYACSPAPIISKQQISAISITSDKDLVTSSGTFPAGESLNFQFLVNSTGHIGAPVSDLIKSPLLDDYIMFTSDAVLSQPQTHKFTFDIKLDDGRKFTLITGAIELLKG